MSLYTTRVLRTVTTEYMTTVEVDAETPEEAIETLNGWELDELRECGKHWHETWDIVNHYGQCRIDNKPVSDFFGGGFDE